MRLLFLIIPALLLAGCQPSLNSQPRLGALAGTQLFRDGAAARPVPAGTRPVRPREVPRPEAGSARAGLEHGRVLYEIHCVACHGLDGSGGLVTERGFGPVPSLNSDEARALSAEAVAAIVRGGQGAMQAMSDRLDETEAAEVARFLRALELSQHAPLARLPAADRAALAGVGP